jgi:hypothetical protein
VVSLILRVLTENKGLVQAGGGEGKVEGHIPEEWLAKILRAPVLETGHQQFCYG